MWANDNGMSINSASFEKILLKVNKNLKTLSVKSQLFYLFRCLPNVNGFKSPADCYVC